MCTEGRGVKCRGLSENGQVKFGGIAVAYWTACATFRFSAMATTLADCSEAAFSAILWRLLALARAVKVVGPAEGRGVGGRGKECMVSE